MSTYAELTARLQQTVENEFSPDQLAGFFRMAEEKLYQTVQPPALRKVATTTTTAGAASVSLPTDYLYAFSVGVVDPTGRYVYLVEKDPTYMQEAYPDTAFQAVPKYYSNFDATSFVVAPTPNGVYPLEITYAAYPESIVTAGETWLSRNFDQVLLNGAMLEAARFMKADSEMLALYTKMFDESLMLYKQYGDGKLRQDAFRAGQARVPVI